MSATAAGALAAAYIPLVVCVIAILIFSWLYVSYFQSKYDKELSSTLTSIFGLTITLMTASLVPVDVFLVSFMKESDGTFKPWASESSERIENGILYTYYTLYACTLFFTFILMPIVYFYYEEKDDDIPLPCRMRFCGALKYAGGFIIVMAVLLVVGAVVPWQMPPAASNETEWERLEQLFSNLKSVRGEEALSFVISCLSLGGFFVLLVYTAYGLSAWPISMIRGSPRADVELANISDQRTRVQEEISAIRDKYSDNRRMTSQDRDRLSELQDSERVTQIQIRALQGKLGSCLYKCGCLLRPFQLLFGFLFIIFGFLIIVGLTLTNVDRILHSDGAKTGYALSKPSIPNPLDILLLFCQKIFPLDYLVFATLVLYFLMATLTAVRHAGIWFLWIRMYKIRPHKTPPQGLLLLCSILMFMVLALNIVIYLIAPQYVTFGNQHYIDANFTNITTTTMATPTSILTTNSSFLEELTSALQVSTGDVLKPEQCSLSAPTDSCTMTRISVLLSTFFFKAWFFGACYYWASWAFVGVFLLGVFVSVVRRPISASSDAVSEDDFDRDDDEELLTP